MSVLGRDLLYVVSAGVSGLLILSILRGGFVERDRRPTKTYGPPPLEPELAAAVAEELEEIPSGNIEEEIRRIDHELNEDRAGRERARNEERRRVDERIALDRAERARKRDEHVEAGERAKGVLLPSRAEMEAQLAREREYVRTLRTISPSHYGYVGASHYSGASYLPWR